MADLLALADDETRGLWDGLRLGYTESTGHPLLRAEIAALYDEIEPDDVLVFAGAEEAIFCLVERAPRAGRPRRRHVARLPEPVRGRPGRRRRGHPPRAARGRALGPRRRAADRRPAAGDAARRRQRAAQPDGDAADPRPVGPALRRAGRPRRSTSSPTRSTATSSSTRPTGSSPAPTRSRAAISLGVMSKSFAMAGLRIGWLATPRPRPPRPLRGVQGLHDDLLVGAVGDPRPHRAAGARAGPRPVAPDRRRQPRAARRLLPPPRRSVRLGPPARRLGRRSRGSSADVPIDELRGASSSRPRACCSCPGSQFGYPGNHFRIGFGRENLPEALAGLERFVERTAEK